MSEVSAMSCSRNRALEESKMLSSQGGHQIIMSYYIAFIGVAQDGGRCRALVGAVIKFRVPQIAVNLLTG